MNVRTLTRVVGAAHQIQGVERYASRDALAPASLRRHVEAGNTVFNALGNALADRPAPPVFHPTSSLAMH